MRLKGKIALVTGASGGLGQGISAAFAREGADCLLAYHSDKVGAERTAALVEGFGRRAVVCGIDISQEAAVKGMIRSVLHAFGRLDIVVANAGVGKVKPLMETNLSDLERLIEVNLIGTYLTVRYGAEPLVAQKRGKIITMSSIHGLGATHWNALYQATKAGIINFTRGAAFDLSSFNIQVNSIAPGAVPVPKDPPPPADSPINEAWMRYTPCGRFGTPEDVAAAALYLASSDSDWVTGQVLSVDGGISAGPRMPSLKDYDLKPKT
ncbi:MAG: SDR family NAD(P)-dependent oxidoreductase [Pirellulaceae bacterium]|nr:SDR family NAD(P)-dependent oxidoreductase [Pirellulaceae bacterium]